MSLSLSPVYILQCKGLVVSLLSLFKQNLTCISEPKYSKYTPCVFEWLIIVVIIITIIILIIITIVIFNNNNKDSDGDNGDDIDDVK